MVNQKEKQKKSKELAKRFLRKPTRKNFDSCKKDELAFLLVCRKLFNQSKFRKLFNRLMLSVFLRRFEEWKMIYDSSSGELREFAFRKMSKFSKFQMGIRWYDIYIRRSNL